MSHQIPTSGELQYCKNLTTRLERVREHLNTAVIPSASNPLGLFHILAKLRELQGNISNDVSFAATLLARDFLHARFSVTFDAAEKPQGAPGIDIDIQAPSGERIIGEIKTTVPHKPTDFGAQQLAAFEKDFVKLAEANAAHKFMFVTDSRAYRILQKPRYLAQIPGVCLVNLGTGEEHVA